MSIVDDSVCESIGFGDYYCGNSIAILSFITGILSFILFWAIFI